MTRYNQPKIKKIISSRITSLGLFFILILIIYALIKNSGREEIVSNNTAKLSQEIQAIEKENRELAELIKYFSSSEFVDKEAREKLNMIKPGEKVVVVPQENNSEDWGNENEKNNFSNWRLWIKYLFE